MPDKTPSRKRRIDRGWLMRQSAAWADEVRVLAAGPLRGRMLKPQPVAVRFGRRMPPRRLTAL
jgi:hypothetical protein